MTTNRDSHRTSKPKVKRSPSAGSPKTRGRRSGTTDTVASVEADPVNRVIYEPQKTAAIVGRAKKVVETPREACHSSTTILKKPDEKPLSYREKRKPDQVSFREAAMKLKASADSILRSMETEQDLSASYDEFKTTARSFAKLILEERIRKQCESLSPDALPSELFDSLDRKIAFADTIRSWLSAWNLGFCDRQTGHVHQLYATSAGNSTGAFCLSQYGATRDNKIKAWSRILEIIADPQLEDITPGTGRNSTRSR